MERHSPIVNNYQLRRLAGFDTMEPPAALPDHLTWVDEETGTHGRPVPTRRVWIEALRPSFYSDLASLHADTFDAFAWALAVRLRGAHVKYGKVTVERSAEGSWGLLVAEEFIPSPVHRDDDLDSYVALARWVDHLEPDSSVWETAG